MGRDEASGLNDSGADEALGSTLTIDVLAGCRYHDKAMIAEPHTANDIVQLLFRHAEQKPDAIAFRFLVDGEVTGRVDAVTYAELAKQVSAIAAVLREEIGAAPSSVGQRALLLYPPGLDFIAAFFGCLRGNVIAVPAYPPDPSRLDTTLPRLQAIARDAGVQVVLTINAFKDMAAGLATLAPDLFALRWIATDSIAWSHASASLTGFQCSASDIAFLQYTSGSTSAPKGVVITHGNLMANSNGVYRVAEHWRPDSVQVCWVPNYHDMGLIGGIVQPVFAAIPGILLSPIAFLQRPSRWLRAISKYRGTSSAAPNFALDLCVKKVTPEEIRALDLRSWRVALNGAEPIRAESLTRFSETFAPAGFSPNAHYPAYGLAEATVMVSGSVVGAETKTIAVSRDKLLQGRVVEEAGDKTLVGCGRPLDEHEVAIVDVEKLTRSAAGEVGEIWFRGPSVAAGYWNRPDETSYSFGAKLTNGEGPFMRTGDLGFMHDGHLYVTGRIKDLIILRGKNHYPQDIELTVERANSAVRPGCVTAFSVETPVGDEGLAVVAEVRAGESFESIALSIRDAILAEHEIAPLEIAVIEVGRLPKTSSGKVRRKETKRMLADGTLNTLFKWAAPVAPVSKRIPVHAPDVGLDDDPDVECELPSSDELHALTPDERAKVLERYLVSRAAFALGLLPSQIDREAPLRDFGLDSIAAVSLQGDLERELGLALSLSALLSGSGGIRDVAQDLARQMLPPEPAPDSVVPQDLSSTDVRDMLIALLEEQERADTNAQTGAQAS